MHIRDYHAQQVARRQKRNDILVLAAFLTLWVAVVIVVPVLRPLPRSMRDAAGALGRAGGQVDAGIQD